MKIEMTYCGEPYHSQGGLVLDCDATDGACPSCLRIDIAKLKAELEALEHWNATASAIIAGIDLQAIAVEIGLPFGSEIGPKILPWIREKKVWINDAKPELRAARTRVPL